LTARCWIINKRNDLIITTRRSGRQYEYGQRQPRPTKDPRDPQSGFAAQSSQKAASNEAVVGRHQAQDKRCLESLTILCWLHTFISHALAGGRTLAEARDAAGHCNVSITSGYLHVAVDDKTGAGNLFAFG
jgi:hypothetical protein